MKPIPPTPKMIEIAPRIIWFEPPERALADPIRFMAYAMAYARHEDMRVIREYVSDEDFCEALDRAPPGIIDPRSWAYWNSKMGRYPAPPLPVRRFADDRADKSTRGAHRARTSAMSELEYLQRLGRVAWLKHRRENPVEGLEDTRHRAREEWLEKYRPKTGK